MEADQRKVAGLFGRTVAETLDLVKKEQHDFTQIVIVGIRADGAAKSFKTRMPIRDMALIVKMVDASLTADINRALENA